MLLWRSRIESRGRLAILVAMVSVLAIIMAGGVWALAAQRGDSAPSVTASEGSHGTNLASLVSPEGPGASPSPVWSVGDNPVGSWVELRWKKPTTLDRLTLVQASTSAKILSGLLTFDGGAGVLATAKADSRTVVTFPELHVTTVRFTVASADADAGLSRVLLDDDAASSAATESTSTSFDAALSPTASSSADGSSASALTDGDLSAHETGKEWAAAEGDNHAWVQLSWKTPRLVSAVQIFGPSKEMSPPEPSRKSPLGGALKFSDGSSVVVSGIDADEGQPTTIAFAPRTVTSVRLRLAPRFSSAHATLREFVVYQAGTTPVSWPSPKGGYQVTPAPATCSKPAVSKAAVRQMSLVCPAMGSSVKDNVTVIVTAAVGTVVQARSLVTSGDSGAMVSDVLASATAQSDGRSTLHVSVTELPSGPLALQIAQADDNVTPIYLQLVRTNGHVVNDAGHAPSDMTLQWKEDFDGPLSVSATGAGATYAAIKPDGWGGSQFGDAVFVDPALKAATVATIPGGYLRLRAKPLGDLVVPPLGGQQHAGGILSSARVGAGGFSAQYGYFEARMLAGAGKGTWPAFWMLNTQAATGDNATAGEVDAVELYGHDTSFTCQTLHDWGGKDDSNSTASDCHSSKDLTDWATGWHDFGVRIKPDGATFYIDGRRVADERGLGRSSEPFFYLLDMALGGGWPVDLDSTGGKSDLYVDWVRVYT